MILNLKEFSQYDLSNFHTKIILLAIFVLYVGFTFTELWEVECVGLEECFDFDRRMARLAVWDFNWIKDDFRHFLHMGLLTLSYQLFGNYKVLVLASSVLLLVVTYLFTHVLCKKRIGGIVSVLVVLQSSVFYTYDTSVTYPSFWALFFITSLYLSHTKVSFLSPFSYLLSILGKALTGLFYPAVLAYFWSSNKKRLFYTYLIIGLVGFTGILFIQNLSDAEMGGYFIRTDFQLDNFIMGFVSWMWKGFGADQSTLLLMIIFGFLLFFNRKRISESKPILYLLFIMILTSPFLIGATTFDVWPYREVPLVIITGIIVGLVISNLDKVDTSMFLGKKK